MVDILNVYKICPRCRGEGTVPIGDSGIHDEVSPGQITCPLCNGSGELLWGQMREEEPE